MMRTTAQPDRGVVERRAVTFLLTTCVAIGLVFTPSADAQTGYGFAPPTPTPPPLQPIVPVTPITPSPQTPQVPSPQREPSGPTPAPVSASPEAPAKLVVPAVGESTSQSVRLIGVPTVLECSALDNGGFLTNALVLQLKAIGDPNGAGQAYSAKTQAQAASAAKVAAGCLADKNGTPEAAPKAAAPKTATEAVDLLNQRKQEAERAKAAADAADRAADAKEADAARRIQALTGAQGGTAADDAKRAADAALAARAQAEASARDAAAKQQAVTAALGKCRQFRSAKDAKVTQRCR